MEKTMKPSRVKQAAAAADEQIAAMKAASESPADAKDLVAATQDQPAVDLQVVPPSVETPPATTVTPTDDVAGQLTQFKAELADMTQKWKSQEGVIRQQSQQIDQYQQMIANMNAAPAPAAQPAAAPDAPLWSETAANAFGEDLLQEVRNIVSAMIDTRFASLDTRVDSMSTTVAATSERQEVTANELFERKLTELAPGWATLNEDAAFLAWLKDRPVFGNAILAAGQALDHAGAAEIFNTYTNLTAKAVATTEAPAAERQAELEAQVAPGKARQQTLESKTATEEKTWALSEIQEVYRKKQSRSGKPAYTAEEFAALDREIAAAQRDGRVDYSA